MPPVQNNQPGTGFGSRGKSVGLGPSVTPLGWLSAPRMGARGAIWAHIQIQLRAIGQTWTKPETPGLMRSWWNNGHGHTTQTSSHAQHHGGSTNDSPVQVSPKEQVKIGL